MAAAPSRQSTTMMSATALPAALAVQSPSAITRRAATAAPAAWQRHGGLGDVHDDCDGRQDRCCRHQQLRRRRPWRLRHGAGRRVAQSGGAATSTAHIVSGDQSGAAVVAEEQRRRLRGRRWLNRWRRRIGDGQGKRHRVILATVSAEAQGGQGGEVKTGANGGVGASETLTGDVSGSTQAVRLV